jgi:hypothetical protein
MQWLDAIRALAGAHVTGVRDGWASRGRPGTVHDVIDEIVAADQPTTWPDAVTAAAKQARSAIAADARWQRLTQALDVPQHETEWLALLAACELSPRLTRVLGYLDDASTPAPPTPATGALLWDWPLGYQPGPASALAHWQLAAPVPDLAWHNATPWAVDADVAAYLAGYADWPAIRGGLALPEVEGFECLYPELLDEMRAATAGVTGMGCEVELVGPQGSGRRTMLSQLARALGRTPALLSADDSVRALRAARLLDAVPIWIDDGALIGTDASPDALTLVARTAPSPATPSRVVRLSWTMPATTAAQRQQLWSRSCGEPAPRVVQEWELTPADIQTGAAAGVGFASSVIRNRLRAGTHESMTPLDCPYEWDDLVVPERIRHQLQRFRDQVLLAQDVLDGWEFRRLCPTAAGVTALFAGPSGTGKTMAAQVLARSLELDIFRVDLAEVVNKYIGETEKRLAAVFAECERSNVMVLFDEADALFGQRTRVHDAHDRYANIEVDYLLQRLDTFRGVAVLATNRKSDLDAAFLRRLRTIVDFVAPAPSERLRLWQLSLPRHTSTGEEITGRLDYDWLATSLELTGAEIKSIALSAAFEARSAGAVISTEHVLDASQRELGKRGAVLRLEHLLTEPVAVAP